MDGLPPKVFPTAYGISDNRDNRATLKTNKFHPEPLRPLASRHQKAPLLGALKANARTLQTSFALLVAEILLEQPKDTAIFISPARRILKGMSLDRINRNFPVFLAQFD